MNLVVLKGRIVRDPEVRITGTGKAVVDFTVACDTGKDRTADFISCTAWDKTAELIGKWFSKGKEILLTGSVTREKNGRGIRKEDCGRLLQSLRTKWISTARTRSAAL